MNIGEIGYLNSHNRSPLFTHSYLYILVLEGLLIHTAYINIQMEGSLRLYPQMSESVSVVCTSASPGRRKNKEALPTGEVICSSSHYYWLNLLI